MRVLIVEDEADLADALTVGLRREGYAVDAAGDGTTALDRLSYTPYDAVLLDLNLPDIDGLEVCRAIRTDLDSITRALMLTARDSIEERVAGLDEGADDYLAKPFALPELLRRRDHHGSLGDRRGKRGGESRGAGLYCVVRYARRCDPLRR